MSKKTNKKQETTAPDIRRMFQEGRDRAMSQLMEMGFRYDEALEALKCTSNNVNQAIQLLVEQTPDQALVQPTTQVSSPSYDSDIMSTNVEEEKLQDSLMDDVEEALNTPSTISGPHDEDDEDPPGVHVQPAFREAILAAGFPRDALDMVAYLTDDIDEALEMLPVRVSLLFINDCKLNHHCDIGHMGSA
ncbi:predicted protein [Lichtheimia corymbifera JMRC:FSU:9682]|uniref:UBA domain-containing protein n=1 Tax=Lichtheimia corymbifera JMRC:FSU:9682 TaxID=1263082 RepID=A0A068SC10_9FUNG|nr:predicted protein [Lichtheimia corymbifera JMRC:FSU:9682]